MIDNRNIVINKIIQKYKNSAEQEELEYILKVYVDEVIDKILEKPEMIYTYGYENNPNYEAVYKYDAFEEFKNNLK